MDLSHVDNITLEFNARRRTARSTLSYKEEEKIIPGQKTQM